MKKLLIAIIVIVLLGITIVFEVIEPIKYPAFSVTGLILVTWALVLSYSFKQKS